MPEIWREKSRKREREISDSSWASVVHMTGCASLRGGGGPQRATLCTHTVLAASKLCLIQYQVLIQQANEISLCKEMELPVHLKTYHPNWKMKKGKHDFPWRARMIHKKKGRRLPPPIPSPAWAACTHTHITQHRRACTHTHKHTCGRTSMDPGNVGVLQIWGSPRVW